jgi:uridylate kinase
MATKYKRILLKLSGESLMGNRTHGIDETRLADYARQIGEIAGMGIQTAIVIGGGNIFRGLSGAAKGFDRVKGDQMGMLATVINSLALSSALEKEGIQSTVFTATRMEPIGKLYSKADAVAALERGETVVVAGGTGNPFFTTDTAAALRAVELEADAMLKGTRVDGVYSADPEKDPSAVKFDEITYNEIFHRRLKVMDLTAISLAQDNRLPIVVFDMDTPGNLKKLLSGEKVGTRVRSDHTS